MDVVALTELATSAEVEAPQLALDLGITAYEARQKLAVGLPAVVLFTPDRARTTSLMATLRARGHGVVGCDGNAVVPSGSMALFKRFVLDEDALVLDVAPGADQGEPEGAPGRIRYADLLALVRATHRHTFETHEEKKERKFRPGAALVSGGLVLTKTVTRDIVRTGEAREPVLYVFSRTHAPCLLREGAAQYAGLGEATRPTRVENFATTLRLLRDKAPAVPYEDRLVSVKKFPEPPSDAGAARVFDPETGGVDLLAHLMAMWLSRGARRAGG
jgi:hypothetical protein